MSRFWLRIGSFALLLAGVAPAVRAAEQVTLRNGYELTCDHRGADGGKVRLYFDSGDTNYMEVSAVDIVSSAPVALPPSPGRAKPIVAGSAKPGSEKLTDAQLQPLLAKAGEAFDIDADLLASVVRAESDGYSHAVSRAGARGLMQLMPSTATELGVNNAFAPGQNIAGGTAYLDQLLVRYHDNLPLALAAYNAGPAAVDRWHGIPPYRETRAYVARVIHEYNRRYKLRQKAAARAGQMASLTR